MKVEENENPLNFDTTNKHLFYSYKRLKVFQFKLLFDLVNAKIPLTLNNKKYVLMSYQFISKWGFED